MDYINIPTFDPYPLRPDPERALYPSAPPMRIEAIGSNEVRLTIGEVSRVVDGITLSNAVNAALHNYRRARRF